MKITEQSKALFVAYAKDAGNWSGTPLFNGNVCLEGEQQDKGNLIQLKKAGLVKTFSDKDGSKTLVWIMFTEEGREYAKSLGVEIR